MNNPTFIGALRGVWLLTWKSQIAWRQWPLRAMIAFIALPLVIYVTGSSRENWSRHHPLLNPRTMELNVVNLRRLELTGEQQNQVRQILQEEYDRADTLGRTDAAEVSVDEQNARIADYYDSIDRRVAPLLDPRQLERFRQIERGNRQMAENRANRPRWTWTSPFYHVLINIYFFLVLPLHCVRACGALIRDELQRDTFSFLATRPVSRARLLVTKFLAQTAWLQIVLLLETGLVLGAASLRHIPSLGTLIPVLLAAQFLAVLVWSALGTFLGLLSKRYVALALLYGLVVELGIGGIPTNINTISMMRHLKAILSHNPALQTIYQWTHTGLLLPAGALILASAVFLTLAVLLFTFVEYHPSGEVPK